MQNGMRSNVFSTQVRSLKVENVKNVVVAVRRAAISLRSVSSVQRVLKKAGSIRLQRAVRLKLNASHTANMKWANVSLKITSQKAVRQKAMASTVLSTSLRTRRSLATNLSRSSTVNAKSVQKANLVTASHLRNSTANVK